MDPSSITDADILDTVRRLRTYMSTLDNCHQVYSNMAYVGDAQISTTVQVLLPKIISVGKEISIALKLIENSKSYRDMVKNFNMNEDLENES
jgi:hypothetical protein